MAGNMQQPAPLLVPLIDPASALGQVDINVDVQRAPKKQQQLAVGKENELRDGSAPPADWVLAGRFPIDLDVDARVLEVKWQYSEGSGWRDKPDRQRQRQDGTMVTYWECQHAHRQGCKAQLKVVEGREWHEVWVRLPHAHDMPDTGAGLPLRHKAMLLPYLHDKPRLNPEQMLHKLFEADGPGCSTTLQQVQNWVKYEQRKKQAAADQQANTVGALVTWCMGHTLDDVIARQEDEFTAGVVGWHISTDPRTKKETVVVVFTCVYWLRKYAYMLQHSSYGGIIQVDGTHSVNWNGYPAFPMTTSDAGQHVHYLAWSIVDGESKECALLPCMTDATLL